MPLQMWGYDTLKSHAGWMPIQHKLNPIGEHVSSSGEFRPPGRVMATGEQVSSLRGVSVSVNSDVSSAGKLRLPEYIRGQDTLPQMNGEEKENFIRDLRNCSEDIQQKLQTWKRTDLMKLVSIETDNKRCLINFTKPQLIEHLCKIISTKVCGNEERIVNSVHGTVPSTVNLTSLAVHIPTLAKRKRKNSHPYRLPAVRYCPNEACTAELKLNEDFCKRCSCYICHSFDENKIPSFWLVCRSESNSQGNGCGLSCHLECTLKDSTTGNLENRIGSKLDGSLQCHNCGNVIDLLSCWRRLLEEVNEACRVSDLCKRICLAHKILESSINYQILHENVDSAKKQLTAEVGSLAHLPFNTAHMLISSISSTVEVQNKCAHAISLLDSLPCKVAQSPQSKSCDVAGTSQSTTAELHHQRTQHELIIDLNELPDIETEVPRSTELRISENETRNLQLPISPKRTEESRGILKQKDKIEVGGGGSVEPTPLHTARNVDGHLENYRNYVNVLRQLERDGYIDSGFRKEFLTWLSIKATAKHVKLIGVFIDAFLGDPESLAGQLIHTFGPEVCSISPPTDATTGSLKC